MSLPKRRVLFADLRGCGRSTRNLGDEAYSPAEATHDLVTLLDALSIAESRRTWLLLVERDERIAEQNSEPDDAVPITHELVRDMALASVPTNVWNRDLWPAYRERLGAIKFSSEWAKPWLAGTLPSPRLEGGLEALAQLSPILLLHGRQDMTFPASQIPAALAALPTAEAVIIAGAGHMTHVDRPGEWLAAIQAFLAPSKATLTYPGRDPSDATS